MTVLITLTSAGTDTSTFDLYSNLDGFVTPFETGVIRASLLAGYSSTLVPDYTNVIKIQSLGGCVDYINVTLENTTTTTTSTSTTSTSTTTSTTTAAPIICVEYTASTFSPIAQTVNYIDCGGSAQIIAVGAEFGSSVTFCASEGTLTYGSEVFLVENGACSTTTTTTTELM